MFGLMYKVVLSAQAKKDARKLEQSHCEAKAKQLLRIVMNNPFENPPLYEKLTGQETTYSRRINSQHRLVYQVLPNTNNETNDSGELFQGIIKVVRMWTHYE
jgi:Txe/YoeB family toxin of toxin-antitoxin system